MKNIVKRIFILVLVSLVTVCGNEVLAQNIEKVKFADPQGVGFTFVSLFLIFFTLIVFTVFFILLGKAFAYGAKKMKNAEESDVEDEDVAEVTGDVAAAIAFTMSQYIREIKANQSAIITIRKVARAYSPWSSKIYQIRKSPR